MTKKIIRNYITLIFIMGFSQAFFFAIYQIFLVSRGMNLLQINIINAFFMASIFLLEIPTGSFADVFGRKKSVVWGCFILALSYFTYYLSGSFWLFILAEVIGALGKTFLSGALEAWMVDSLKYHEFDGDMNDVYRKEARFLGMAVISGSLIGGFIGDYSLALPWLCTSFGMILAGVFVSIKFKEEYFSKNKFSLDFSPMVKVAKESVAYGVRHKSIFYIIAFEFLLMLSFQGFNMQWPFVFQNLGLSISQLGMVFVGITSLSILGSQLSKVFAKMIGREKEALIASQVITFLGMILAASFTGLYPVMIWFLIHEGGRGMFKPLKQAYLNKRIESDKRATVLSFDSMISRGGAFVGLLLSGYLAENYSISLSWLVSGIILGVGILIFLRLKNGD